MTKLFTIMLLSTFFMFVPEIKMIAAEQKLGSVESYFYYDGESKPESPSVTQKFYDAQGTLSYELSGSGLTTFSYDENGLLSESISYYMSSSLGRWVFSSKTTYEYDELNQITRQNSLNADDELTGYAVFENYINGRYQDRKNMSADGLSVYYWQQFEYTFNGDVLESAIKKSVSTTDGTILVLGKSDYTYSNNLISGEVYSPIVDGTFDNASDGAYTIDYNYDASGNLISEYDYYISRWGNYIYEYAYNYVNYSVDYTPQNFSAQLAVGEGVAVNSVELTWDAPVSSDVTGYIVIVDDIVTSEVTETTYTTTSLKNGDHKFSVAAVVNGNISNSTDIITLNVYDTGVIAPTNFSVVSIGIQNEDGSYDIEVTWDAPATFSELTGFDVYCNGWSYTSVDANTTSATLNISSWTAVGEDEFGEIIGYDIEFYAIAKYTTGTSEASNTLIVNFVDGTYTAINDVELNTPVVTIFPNPATSYVNFSEPVQVKIYTLTGSVVLVNNSFVEGVNIEELTKGIYIVETVSVTGSKIQSKMMVK